MRVGFVGMGSMGTAMLQRVLAAGHEVTFFARVSANRSRWARTPDGWRITERVNANLDGTPEHRAVLAP